MNKMAAFASKSMGASEVAPILTVLRGEDILNMSIVALSPKRRELLARIIADFTKAIFAVAVASEFFKQLATWMRVALGLAILSGVAGALKIEPKEASRD